MTTLFKRTKLRFEKPSSAGETIGRTWNSSVTIQENSAHIRFSKTFCIGDDDIDVSIYMGHTISKQAVDWTITGLMIPGCFHKGEASTLSEGFHAVERAVAEIKAGSWKPT